MNRRRESRHRPQMTGRPLTHHTASEGFTLLELSMAGAIFLVLFFGVWELSIGTSNAVGFGFVSSDLDMSVRRAIDRISGELQDSGVGAVPEGQMVICHGGTTMILPSIEAQQDHLSIHAGDVIGDCVGGGSGEFEEHVVSHPVSAATVASSVTFNTRIAFNGNAGDWSSPITYSLQASPGEIAANAIDDDGDGVTDEQSLARTQDGITEVLVDGVTALAFARAQDDWMIAITITASRTASTHELLIRTVNSTVAFRNLPE